MLSLSQIAFLRATLENGNVAEQKGNFGVWTECRGLGVFMQRTVKMLDQGALRLDQTLPEAQPNHRPKLLLRVY